MDLALGKLCMPLEVCMRGRGCPFFFSEFIGFAHSLYQMRAAFCYQDGLRYVSRCMG